LADGAERAVAGEFVFAVGAQQRWDHAARTVARDRTEHDTSDPDDTLGPRRSDLGRTR
jgi:hypothetical protein